MRLALTAALAAGTVVASLGSAGTALANCADGRFDEPPPPATVSPADHTVIEQSFVRPVYFTMSTQLLHGSFDVLVARAPTIGVTGLLSDLDTLDDVALLESLSSPEYYAGKAASTGDPTTEWLDVPGTYYWQLYGTIAYNSGECHMYAGPVNTITVTASAPSAPQPQPSAPQPQPSAPQPPPSPPQPPPRSSPSSPGPAAAAPITAAQASAPAARMVRARTGRRPHIGLSCSRTGARTLVCALRWSAGGSAYVAGGRFTRRAARDRTWSWAYDVRGVRTWQTCRGPHRCSTATAPFRWRGQA